MNFDLAQLIDYLQSEPAGEDMFRGRNMPGKRKAVYGGQVMAQALSAAIQTVDKGRQPHSLHCHFLRPGRVELPIEYQVTRVRDGGSFSLRQVTARQDGKTIFMTTVSFQKPEVGLEHQQQTPVMVPRQDMISEWDHWQRIQQEVPGLIYLRPDNFTALDILSNFRPGVKDPEPQAPRQHFWFRANGILQESADHYLVIAFESDLLFMNTALHAHPYTLIDPDVQAASLDHSLWFYGDIDATQWLYYDMESPMAAGGRGLNHGYFYTETGKLIAATTQEGLMRTRR